MKMTKPYQCFTLQQDQSDCGVACLISIVKYYGGSNTLENLRKLSGTSISGTTLLGLYQAAKNIGFDAEGCEADMDALIEYGQPCILHTNQNHYVVYFGTEVRNNRLQFVIGDPAKGIFYLDEDELDALWESKKCLELLPNEDFRKAEDIKREKYKWIANLIKTDRTLLGIAVVLGVFIAALGLAMAIFSQKLIDDILPKKQYVKLETGIGFVFILLLVKEFLSALRQRFLLDQSKDFNVRITSYFYDHLLQLPKAFFDTRKIGELTARLNDTSRIQRVISQLAGNVVIDALVAIISTIFVFIYSVKVGVACLIVSPFFYTLIYWHKKTIVNGQQLMMREYAIAEANYVSTLQGIEVIKNHNKQELYSASGKKIYQGYQNSIFSLGKIQIKLSFLANAFCASFLILVVSFTSYQVIHGQLKTGEMMAILGICASLLPSIANLALISIPVNEAKIAFDRMFEFTGIASEPNNYEYDIKDFESLQIRDVSFRFPGRSPIIKNFDLEIKKGEITAIIGENGCGKSTLIQLLLKHYLNESGELIVNEQLNLRDINTHSWRKLIGLVPQQVQIFNGTVLDNIAFDDAQTNIKEILDFLHQYGFTSFLNTLPQSVMTIVGEEGINLSGGQKQIIALARALYLKPQLLILDEATAAMDRDSEQFVIRLLLHLRKETGIIFISHRLHLLKSFCDKICILEKGVISGYGTHAELLESQNLYNVYWSDLFAKNIT